MIFALDTNIISAILKGESSVIARFNKEVKLENEFIIPLPMQALIPSKMYLMRIFQA